MQQKRLVYQPTSSMKCVVSPDPPLAPALAVNDFWGDFGGMITSILVAIAVILATFLFFTLIVNVIYTYM